MYISQSRKLSSLLIKIGLLGIVIGLLLITNPIAAGANSSPNPDRNVEAFKRKLDEEVPKWQKRYGVPGVAIGIVHGGKAAYTLNYGYADKRAQKALTGDTLFQAGSVSKSVAAWGVLRLADQGVLSLDDPVGKYLTRWQLPAGDYRGEVTIRRLLSHTAGLPAHKGYLGSVPGKPLPSLEQSLTEDELTIGIKPGMEALYTGAGYSILQLVIEEVTGMPFETFMKESVLKPLGMKSSSFRQNAANANLAKAYGYFGRQLPSYQFTETAAAGLQTTTTDMITLILASMEGTNGEEKGRGVIRGETADLMQTPVIGENGLGVFARTLPDGGTLLYHSGDNRGWHALYGFMPDRQDGLVILTNSENGVDLRQDIYHAWVEYETGTMPESFYTLSRHRKTNTDIASILGVSLGLYVLLVTVEWFRGKRAFLTKHRTSRYGRFAIRVSFLSLLGTVLVLAASNSMVSLHSNLKIVALLLFVWIIAFIASGLFPKYKKESSSTHGSLSLIE